MGREDEGNTVRPASEAELARVLGDIQRNGFKMAPVGGGTKSEWGDPPEPVDVVVSTLGLDRVVEHAAGDMTVTVEAGCTIAALQGVLASSGQRLALDPLWPGCATVGGVLATNDSGSLRSRFGSLRDLILGVTVALPDGTLARSGGKVVKNVAGYDLPKLMVGAFGTLGVITQATFRLHPLPRATRTVSFNAASLEGATRFVLAVLDSTLEVTGLQVLAGGPTCRLDVRTEGSPAGIDASTEPLAKIAGACGVAEADCVDDAWAERERLWETPGIVAKMTFLPSRLAELCGAVCGGEWRIVAQGIGVALLVTGADGDEVMKLAQHTAALGGSLVVLRGPSELKRRVNVLGTSNAMPLMRAVKKQFDPSGTLNPGRLGGGI